MSARIRASHGIPAHDVEVGYLRDLLSGINALMHPIYEREGMRTITAELLAEWPLVHRNACRCTAFSRVNVSLMALTDRPLDSLYDIHREDLVLIDAFIKALQLGLSEGALTKHVTDRHLSVMWQVVGRLQACETKARWE